MKVPNISQSFIEKAMDVETPAILYSQSIIDYFLNKFKSDSKNIINVEHCFSIKANRNVDVLSYLSHLDLGFDVASEQEFDVARKIGSRSIYATFPSADINFIRGFYREGHIFDFDSMSQLIECRDIIKSNKIGLRIKIPLTSNYRETYGINSRFGFNGEEFELIKFLNENKVQVSQYHIHVGEKQTTDLVEIIERVKYLIENYELYKNVMVFNFGGGYSNLYLGNNNTTLFWKELGEFSVYLRNRSKKFRIVLEPGKLITLLSGFLISKTKASNIQENGKRNIVLDSSAFNLFTWHRPKVVFPKGNKSQEITNIYGCSCYENDIYALDLPVNRIGVNDKVIISPAGAYVSSMNKSLHGIPRPFEHFVYDS
jgi:diaminopimelate decarboxylase